MDLLKTSEHFRTPCFNFIFCISNQFFFVSILQDAGEQTETVAYGFVPQQQFFVGKRFFIGGVLVGWLYENIQSLAPVAPALISILACGVFFMMRRGITDT